MTLKSKFDLYAQYSGTAWRQDDCDSLLFESLRGCVKGQNPDIDAAFNGRWWRRPHGWQNQCYNASLATNEESFLMKCLRITALKLSFPKVSLEEIIKENWYRGSTISRDQLVGLAWYALHNNRLDISEGVIDYALKHGGKMGDGDPTRTNIMPSLLATFAWVSYKLGGPSRPWLRWVQVSTGKCVGFEAHLQTLHILLRSEMRGWRTDKERTALQWQYDRVPANPLFALAVGDFRSAEISLGESYLWPEDRLPTNHDRKEPYLPQRDQGKDWMPDLDADKITHPGSDYIFCYALMTGLLK